MTSLRRARAPGAALAVISMTQLMLVLDVTIVNVALPAIQHALSFGNDMLPWVVTAYTTAFAVFLLTGGACGDRYGHRNLFVVSIGVFSAASAAAALAASPGWLVAARAVQGAGAAFASAGALALIATSFPQGTARARAYGIYSAMSGAGLAAGLLAGGALAEYASWRWVFLVNVPPGVLIMLVAPRVLTESTRQANGIDVAGTALSGTALGAFVYALSRATSAGWADRWTLALLVSSVVLAAAFVCWQRRAATPLAPAWLFAQRRRLGAYAVMLLLNGALFGLFYFLTQFFQDVEGYTPRPC